MTAKLPDPPASCRRRRPPTPFLVIEGGFVYGAERYPRGTECVVWSVREGGRTILIDRYYSHDSYDSHDRER